MSSLGEALEVVGRSFDELNHPWVASVEADLFPKNKPERADLIDGSIGELSPVRDTFGYYAHGVAAAVAILPRDWRDRLIAIHNQNTRGATGWCLEIHDLLISKLIAGREKDLDFSRVALQEGLASPDLLSKRLGETEIADDCIRVSRGQAAGACNGLRRRGTGHIAGTSVLLLVGGGFPPETSVLPLVEGENLPGNVIPQLV